MISVFQTWSPSYSPVKSITCLASASEIFQGWKLAFTVYSSFVEDSRHCCGCLAFYLIEGNNALKGTIGFVSVMSETQKNESLGWKNCLLFFPLISPGMVSGWNLKIYSFKPTVDVLNATWILHSLADQTASMPCVGCCGYRSIAI